MSLATAITNIAHLAIEGGQGALLLLIQSTLILGAGLLFVRWAGRWAAAVQSACCRTTLAAAIVSPCLWIFLAGSGFAVARVHVPFWSRHHTAVPDGLTLSVPPTFINRVDSIPPLGSPSENSETPNATSVPIPGAGHGTVFSVVANDTSSAKLAPATPIASQTTTLTNGDPMWVEVAFGVFCIAWLAISVILLARVVASMIGGRRLVHLSCAAERSLADRCRHLAKNLNVRPPAIRRSPFVASACVFGWRRTVILLPETDVEVTDDVLIHELAHLARGDCFWKLVAELATVLLWFQPLLWRLKSRMQACAEEVCDDFVVQCGADRCDYAERLTQIAERYRPQASPVGIGIVSFRSTLGRRVARILDSSRSLQTHVSRRTLAGFLAGAAVVVVATSLIDFGRPEQKLLADEPISNLGGTAPLAGTATVPWKAGDTSTRMAAETLATQRRSLTVSGRVVDEKGSPIEGAHVAAVAQIKFLRIQDVRDPMDLLGETITDRDGQFHMVVVALPQTDQSASFIARSDGYGVAWHPFRLDAKSVVETLRLPKEQTIRGRFVDLEGRPEADVHARVVVVETVAANEPFPPHRLRLPGELVACDRWRRNPAAWPDPVVADRQGRFLIRGVGVGQGVQLEVEGSDRFAPQLLNIDTRIFDRRAPNDSNAAERLSRDPKGRMELMLPLAPGRILEGTVRYEDTQEPAANEIIEVRSNLSSPAMAKTDLRGRFRLIPRVGNRISVNAYPPDGTSYLIGSKEFEWKTADVKTDIDVAVPRGILVRGKVLEAGSHRPIEHAVIEYYPETATVSRAGRNIVADWWDVQHTNSRGEFAIAVLPGPARLLVFGPTADYILQEIGERELKGGASGGERYRAHAIVRIDPPPRRAAIDLTIPLQKGTTLSGRVLTPDVRPAEAVLVFSRLQYQELSPWWVAIRETAVGGRFQLTGCSPGVEYPVYFLDAQNRLGATARLRAGSLSQETIVRLTPCGAVKMRYVDLKNQPIADFHGVTASSLLLVVNPGPFHIDRGAIPLGELGADEDFVYDVDPRNYPLDRKTDAEGGITYHALIPGATYRFVHREGNRLRSKLFAVKSGETLDLGNLVIERPRAK